MVVIFHCLKIHLASSRSDEGEWLKALEDGEVDERGYLPKKKGQGNLTARQASVSVIICTCRSMNSISKEDKGDTVLAIHFIRSRRNFNTCALFVVQNNVNETQ